MKRWLRFNAIGIVGAVVQLAALRALIGLGVHYLTATVLAVELAIVHNFLWHLRWTWRDRVADTPFGPGSGRRRWAFVRFQLANGLVSLISNLALMRLLAGHLGVPPVPANLIAIAVTSLLNFVLGDRWVFRRGAGSGQRKPSRSTRLP